MFEIDRKRNTVVPPAVRGRRTGQGEHRGIPTLSSAVESAAATPGWRYENPAHVWVPRSRDEPDRGKLHRHAARNQRITARLPLRRASAPRCLARWRRLRRHRIERRRRATAMNQQQKQIAAPSRSTGHPDTCATAAKAGHRADSSRAPTLPPQRAARSLDGAATDEQRPVAGEIDRNG